MPSFTDTDPDDHLSDPEEHSDDDDDSGSDDGSEASSDSGRGASHSFTSPGTLNDTSTRTSGSLEATAAAAAALQLGQQEEEADEDTSINDDAVSMSVSMSQRSANHPQRLFQSQDDGGSAIGGQPQQQQKAPAPAGESHPLPQQQSANTSSDINDEDNEDGVDEDEATGAPLSSSSGEVLTAPGHDGPPALGPNGTIVRNNNKRNGDVVLTAPDDNDPERVGPTGTIVRQPRGAGSQKQPAVEAEAAGTDGDDESGDNDDDESSSDKEEEEDDDDGTLNSHERERARILRVTHNELTNMVRALFLGAYIRICFVRCLQPVILCLELTTYSSFPPSSSIHLFRHNREQPSDVRFVCTPFNVPPSSPASTHSATTASANPSTPTVRRGPSRPRVPNSRTPTSVPRARLRLPSVPSPCRNIWRMWQKPTSWSCPRSGWHRPNTIRRWR